MSRCFPSCADCLSVAMTQNWPHSGAIAPCPGAWPLRGATFGHVAHITVPWSDTRVCLHRLLSRPVPLIKLLLHSRWEALHLFKSSPPTTRRKKKEKTQCDGFYKGINGGSKNGLMWRQLKRKWTYFWSLINGFPKSPHRSHWLVVNLIERAACDWCN